MPDQTLYPSPLTQTELFLKEVLEGLSAPFKYLPAKYFYNQHGNALFQQITKLPSYYLYGCEKEILEQQAPRLVELLVPTRTPFDLIEFGPGDASKSLILMKSMFKKHHSFRYLPVDFSAFLMPDLERKISGNFPEIPVKAYVSEFLPALNAIQQFSNRPKIILFLGASIGNFSPKETRAFLKEMNVLLKNGDQVLIGFDLKKDPETVLHAYNEPEGITKAFNLNLLTRINNELQADFDVSAYEHRPSYNESNGACESFLVSKKEQSVRIKEKHVFRFRKKEKIFMERSMKYTLNEIEKFAQQANFSISHHFLDSKKWFTTSLWLKP